MNLRKSFTLVEVIMAIAISAIVMFGCAELMFNIVGVSKIFERQWSLRSHIDGVEKFLRVSLQCSSISDVSKIPDVLFSRNENSILIARLPNEIDDGIYRLVFSEKKSHPVYQSATNSAGEKICYINFKEGRGLSIIWFYFLPETENDDAIIYETKISKYVSKVEYLYKDSERWKETLDLNRRISEMPTYIKITFSKGDEEIVRIIPLNFKIKID